MHIKRIKKKDSVYLAQYESYRENGKVKTRFIKYLVKEGDERGVPLPKKSAHIETPLYPEHSKRAGDVQLMWSIADSTLNPTFPELITRPAGPPPSRSTALFAHSVSHPLAVLFPSVQNTR